MLDSAPAIKVLNSEKSRPSKSEMEKKYNDPRKLMQNNMTPLQRASLANARIA